MKLHAVSVLRNLGKWVGTHAEASKRDARQTPQPGGHQLVSAADPQPPIARGRSARKHVILDGFSEGLACWNSSGSFHVASNYAINIRRGCDTFCNGTFLRRRRRRMNGVADLL